MSQSIQDALVEIKRLTDQNAGYIAALAAILDRLPETKSVTFIDAMETADKYVPRENPIAGRTAEEVLRALLE